MKISSKRKKERKSNHFSIVVAVSAVSSNHEIVETILIRSGSCASVKMAGKLFKEGN